MTATPFADTHYCWLACARSNTHNGTQHLALARAATDAKTPTCVEVICATAAGALVDTTDCNLMAYR